MKKDMLRGIVGFGVVLVLYLLVVFLMPFVHTASFWVSLLFTLIAFGVVAAAFYCSIGRHPDAKSKFYGFPIARIAVIYGLVQLIAGFLCMAYGVHVPVWAAFLVYAIALGAAVIGLISAESVTEHIKTQDAELKKNVALMRVLQSRIGQLSAQTEDAALKALAEEFRYSDPVSSPALEEVERDLTAAVEDLESAVLEGDTAAIAPLCHKASTVLAERNRLCKLSKN